MLRKFFWSYVLLVSSIAVYAMESSGEANSVDYNPQEDSIVAWSEHMLPDKTSCVETTVIKYLRDEAFEIIGHLSKVHDSGAVEVFRLHFIQPELMSVGLRY